ncbi:ClbS/DfsB family four-helix bundle protein [Patulibacter sp. SYSU D01012]|uniref:ClbS/DfsB family four-helix bundle protein n=1 Tax=Patulibacter sp. SYSU D01012 TaxID=2817381 RepID=UPI001B30D4A7
MTPPATLAELERDVERALGRLEAELDAVADAGQDDLPCVDGWTVHDVAAVRTAWAEMTRDWIAAGRRGEAPPTPAAGYGWNQTPALNAAIVTREAATPLDELRRRLRAATAACLAHARDLDGPDLLEPRRFAWTRTWPVLRWIHANTTAQQEKARTLIRRARRAAAAGPPTPEHREGGAAPLAP